MNIIEQAYLEATPDERKEFIFIWFSKYPSLFDRQMMKTIKVLCNKTEPDMEVM